MKKIILITCLLILGLVIANTGFIESITTEKLYYVDGPTFITNPDLTVTFIMIQLNIIIAILLMKGKDGNT